MQQQTYCIGCVNGCILDGASVGGRSSVLDRIQGRRGSDCFRFGWPGRVGSFSAARSEERVCSLARFSYMRAAPEDTPLD